MSASDEQRPLVSLITVCFDAMTFLPDCVESVRAQIDGRDDIEHLVIDGASRDGTAEWLAAQGGLRFVSEPDEGISDAMNKGLRHARGRWVLFLNADDELAPGAAEWLVAMARTHPDVSWIQGSVTWIDPEGTEVGRQVADVAKLSGLRRSTKFNQQAALMRQDLFERLGEFDRTFRYVMDYDFWLRVFRTSPPLCFDRDVARYRMHDSSTSRSNVWPAEFEKHRARMKNREALGGMSLFESLFYVGATYWRSPTIDHYLAIGAARRGQRWTAMRHAARNWLHKPVQSPEHLLAECVAVVRGSDRCHP